MQKIRIIIVEDDQDWLDAIVSFLKKESDFEITSYAMSRDEALSVLKVTNADIILLDISLNGNKLDGIDAIDDIRKVSKAEIIMVTSLDDKEIVMDSIEAGAVHYVLKGEFLILPHIIRNVARCRSPVQILSKEYVSLKRENRLSSLTVSERSIFDLICAGVSRKQIEIEQNKSTNTVRNQISSLLKKLGAKNCHEIIKKYCKTKKINLR